MDKFDEESMVEARGFEPLAPFLQSRCKPDETGSTNQDQVHEGAQGSMEQKRSKDAAKEIASTDTSENFTMGVLLNKPFKMSWNIAPLTDKSRRTLHRLVSSLVSNTGVSESRWDARWLDEDNEWLILLDGEAAGVTLTKAALAKARGEGE